MTNFFRNEMQSDIALYIGNYIRRHGYTPDINTLVRDKGLGVMLSNAPYIMGLVLMGMLRFSYVTPAKRLSVLK
ncbi:MAG: hypothetical protein K6B41_10775 [Butyrivibrio sp.]|nr:hypothetical protein [Butyrivibrio sp.]